MISFVFLNQYPLIFSFALDFWYIHAGISQNTVCIYNSKVVSFTGIWWYTDLFSADIKLVPVCFEVNIVCMKNNSHSFVDFWMLVILLCNSFLACFLLYFFLFWYHWVIEIFTAIALHTRHQNVILIKNSNNLFFPSL